VRSRIAIGCAATAIAACASPSIRIWPDAIDPTSLVITAIDDGHGRLDVVVSHAHEVKKIQVASGDLGKTSAFTFAIVASDFAHADGSEVTAEELDGVHIRSAGDPAAAGFGDCGRCLAPWGSAPQPVLAGDSCAPPIFVPQAVWTFSDDAAHPTKKSALDPLGLAALEKARKRIRLEWPGGCACAIPTHTSSASLVLEPVAPVASPFPADAFAQWIDGTVGAFSQQYAVAVLPDGHRFEAFGAPLFGGEVEAAIALPPAGTSTFARFFVASDRDDHLYDQDTDFSILEISNGALTKRAVTSLGLPALAGPVVPSAFVPIDLEMGKFMILGAAVEPGVFNQPIATICDAEVDGTRCQGTGPNCGEFASAGVNALTWFDDGTAVAAMSQGAAQVFGYRAPNGDWICDGDLRQRTYGPVATATESAQVDLLRSVAHLGRRAFVCARKLLGDTGRAESVVLTASIARGVTAARDLVQSTTWQVAKVLPIGDVCFEFSPVPGAMPPRMRLSVTDGTAIDFGADGSAIGPPRALSELYPQISGPVSAVFTRAPGWTLVAAGGGSGSAVSFLYDAPLVSLDRQSDGGSFEHVLGPPALAGVGYRVLVRSGDSAIGLRSGSIERITATRSGIAIEPLVIAGLPDDFMVHAAASDTSTAGQGTIVVAGQGAKASAIFRVAIDRKTATPLPIPSGVSIDSTSGLVEPLPGQFALMSDDHLYWWKDGAWTAMPDPADDDPLTTPIETAASGGLLAIDASLGIVWTGGGNRVFRVHGPSVASGGIPRGERYAIDPRLVAELTAVDNWAIVPFRALCPDLTLIGAIDDVLEAAPASLIHGTAPNDAPEILIEPFDGVNQAMTVRKELYHEPTMFLGPNTNVATVFALRRVARDGVFGARVPFRVNTSVTMPDGRILIGGPDGRLAIERRP
jgi:hypothetical protein